MPLFEDRDEQGCKEVRDGEAGVGGAGRDMPIFGVSLTLKMEAFVNVSCDVG